MEYYSSENLVELQMLDKIFFTIRGKDINYIVRAYNKGYFLYNILWMEDPNNILKHLEILNPFEYVEKYNCGLHNNLYPNGAIISSKLEDLTSIVKELYKLNDLLK